MDIPNSLRVNEVVTFDLLESLIGGAIGSWPGRVIYHFDVDGAAWLDPHDEGRILNAWGSEYSVRYVNSPG